MILQVKNGNRFRFSEEVVVNTYICKQTTTVNFRTLALFYRTNKVVTERSNSGPFYFNFSQSIFSKYGTVQRSSGNGRVTQGRDVARTLAPPRPLRRRAISHLHGPPSVVNVSGE